MSLPPPQEEEDNYFYDGGEGGRVERVSHRWNQ